MKQDKRPLLKRLRYQFKEPSLFEDALTHRSAGASNNERLEFLGDGALNFVIAEQLFRREPRFKEGDLSRQRASLVRGETLAEIAHELELGDYLKLGSGELKSGGFRRDSILADALEAVLGAIYLDGGFDGCRDVILHLYSGRLDNLPDAQKLKDPKTRLQEYLQGKGMALPEYELVSATGKAHEQQFLVECRVPDMSLTTRATATSRRKAEQSAAQSLLTSIEQRALRANAE